MYLSNHACLERSFGMSQEELWCVVIISAFDGAIRGPKASCAGVLTLVLVFDLSMYIGEQYSRNTTSPETR